MTGIRAAINEKTKLVTIQRSKGYQTRPTFSVRQIGELIAFVKSVKPDLDLHGGQLLRRICRRASNPPTWARIMTVGSLIKNPGGGLAPIGGYIVRHEDVR